MKHFFRTSLPDKVAYNGNFYFLDAKLSSLYAQREITIGEVKTELQGRKVLCVNVLPKRLEGKTDLHGNSYKANQHFFTTK